MRGRSEKPYLSFNKNLSAQSPFVSYTGHKDIHAQMERAAKFHQAGNLQMAQKIYLGILEDYPDHSDSFHLLGLINYQTGNPADAAIYISQAIH